MLDVHCCARVVFPPLFVDANGEIRDVPQEIARVGTALARRCVFTFELAGKC